MQKGQIQIILIGVLVVAIALAGGLYLGRQTSPKPSPAPVITQTPQPFSSPKVTTQTPQLTPSPTANLTANWKTYEHPLKFFSFKLPPDWTGDISSNPIQFINYDLSKAAARGFDPKLDQGKLKVQIYVDTVPMELKDYVAEEKRDSVESYGEEEVKKSWTETPISVGNQSAIKVSSNLPGFVVYTVYTKDPSKLAIISISFLLDFENNKELANQILSTFKFLP